MLKLCFVAQKSEAGKIIPHSFSKIRQDEHLRLSQKTDLDLQYQSRASEESVSDPPTPGEEFDLLSTILQEFNNTGECDVSEHEVSENISVLASDDTEDKVQFSQPLSESLCDDIFNELEKNSTFPSCDPDEDDTVSRYTISEWIVVEIYIDFDLFSTNLKV